jgi:hypothetical protein
MNAMQTQRDSTLHEQLSTPVLENKRKGYIFFVFSFLKGGLVSI